MNNLEEFVILALRAFNTSRMQDSIPTTEEFELHLRRAIMQKQAESVTPTKTLLQG